MCFSATASFVASGSVAAIGAASLLKAKDPRVLPYAAVPILFAAQQAAEGVVWLTMGASDLGALAVKAYLLFAYAYWPAFIPWAVRMAEPSTVRRKWMFPLMLIGFVIGLAGLRVVLASPTPVAVLCGNLRYGMPLIHPAYGILYVGIGCVTCFVSSSRWIVAFGAALAVSCAVAFAVYANAGPSVWCFFAAILSVLVYFRVRQPIPANAKKRT